MSQDYLVTSNVPWFRNDADRVIRNIARATFGHEIPMDPGDLFRPPVVQDAESRHGVDVAYERISRWSYINEQPGGDLEHPNNVFHIGFMPRVRPAQGQFPTQGFNLGSYVQDNTPSIFVGATRYTRNAQGRLTLWERRLSRATQHRFQYEIFAFGGIDVNHVLGNTHEYANQNEIAFPGGIRPQFIRSAREFRGAQLVAIWDNPRFDPSANGQHAPHWDQLPHVIRGVQVPVYFFTQRDQGNLPAIQHPEHHHDELSRRRRDSGINEDENDGMRGPGEQIVDNLLESMAIPRIRRASFLDPRGNGNAYFFVGNQYAVINVRPGTTDDVLVNGPKPILGNWASLVRARFGNVDAILPNPASPIYEAYFFFGTQYVLINTRLGSTDDYIINGPKDIANEWPSLRQAGFSSVDAVLPNPRNIGEAYFFSGIRYALIRINPGTNNDYIVNGPKFIANEWPSLRQAGFTTIDSVLRNPANSEEAYFFSGSQYALINIKPGSNNDYIVNGPKTVADNWHSLNKAAFY
ncbi:hypothetical protein M413DRAFT_27915 [Hebeloma cylindrosporum]|uniref:Pierisin-like domain-containing protein n=1 Tax=Hebeloma cylindrosporum TaxID=76867 RepID=A0A0C3BYG9_HEBCY|nr:hypothetical protein M413DRAFT_27915 [Hebeloma cylindrosporum h7]